MGEGDFELWKKRRNLEDVFVSPVRMHVLHTGGLQHLDWQAEEERRSLKNVWDFLLIWIDMFFITDDIITECDISVSKLLGFETFPFFLWYRYRFRIFLVSKKVSVLVSKKIGIGKSIGIGFKKIWHWTKYRYWFRKYLVSKKVLVSKNFGIEKSIGIGFEKILLSQKVSVSVSKMFVLKKDTNIHDLFHHLEPWTIWAKKSVFN